MLYDSDNLKMNAQNWNIGTGWNFNSGNIVVETPCNRAK